MKGVWKSTDNFLGDGPYKCSECGGSVILDAVYIYEHDNENYHCPYCNAEMSSILESTTKNKLPPPNHPFRRHGDHYPNDPPTIPEAGK